MIENNVFERAPDRTIWSALLEVVDDGRLHHLHVEADRIILNQRRSGATSAQSLKEGAEWSDFSIVIRDEQDRREDLFTNVGSVPINPVRPQIDRRIPPRRCGPPFGMTIWRIQEGSWTNSHESSYRW
jgi:hypothetical protein